MGSPLEEAHHAESTVWRLVCSCQTTLSGDNLAPVLLAWWWNKQPECHTGRGPNQSGRPSPRLVAAWLEEDPTGHPQPIPPIP